MLSLRGGQRLTSVGPPHRSTQTPASAPTDVGRNGRLGWAPKPEGAHGPLKSLLPPNLKYSSSKRGTDGCQRRLVQWEEEQLRAAHQASRSRPEAARLTPGSTGALLPQPPVWKANGSASGGTFLKKGSSVLRRGVFQQYCRQRALLLPGYKNTPNE